MTAEWSAHACRHCGARLLMRQDAATGRSSYECGSCSITVHGEPDGLCGCGILPRPVRAAATGPRFHCIPNPARGVTSPAAIIISFDEAAP